MMLRMKQIAALDAYSEVSGFTRGEILRRSLELFFRELADDEQYRERYEKLAKDGRFWTWGRDEGCRSPALPEPLRYPLPPACAAIAREYRDAAE